MPSFTAQSPNLQVSGPVVDMRVWIGTAAEEAIKKTGSKIPDPYPVKGMIDTGATGSVIQPAAVESLAIEAPLLGQQIQCLIGRDVLAHGVLVYTGYINQFTLSF